jgi:hypothetical protein
MPVLVKSGIRLHNLLARLSARPNRKSKMRVFVAILLSLASAVVSAQTCFRTSVMAPSPLMGNHGEIFRTIGGTLFEVVGSYEYLYAYYPEVTICPVIGKMLVEGKTVGIRAVGGGTPNPPQPIPAPGDAPSKTSPSKRSRSGDAPIEIVLRVSGCDYFVADGPNGYYILEWYGGYDPGKGDGIYGEIRSYGFKNIILTR